MPTQEGEQETVPFTEWGYGFRPGSTGRNILVGVIYWFTIFVSVFVLVYSWYQNREQASKASTSTVGVLTMFVVFMYIASVIGAVTTGPGGPVVDIDAHEQTTAQFEVEEGDLIRVHVTQPQGEGVRTHVLLRAPEETLLSEGVLDEKTYEYEAHTTGNYTVTMTPATEEISTTGQVEVVLVESEDREDG
ncbi:hypothetical protein V9T20_12505 (plasmid) [Halobacterium salinarum]|uniref:hypothetical protein n=1 Tax=Halobacterium salinarum TaxID=2242 RepID=UPI0030D3ABB6